MVNSCIRMEKDELFVISTSIKYFMSQKANQRGYQDLLEFQNGDWFRAKKKKGRCVEKLERI